MKLVLVFLCLCCCVVKSQCDPQSSLPEGEASDSTTPASVKRSEAAEGTTERDTWPIPKRKKSVDICKMKRYKTVIVPHNGYIRYFINETSYWKGHEKYVRVTVPKPITHWWGNAPYHIDAIYMRPYNQQVAIFSGQQYWLYYGFHVILNYPQPLTRFGFPKHVKKINAAINWRRSRRGQNKWTTFFAGNEIYSYNELTRDMIKGNPDRVELWNTDLGAVTRAMNHPDHYKKSVLFVGNKAIVMDNSYQQDKNRTIEQRIDC